MEIFKLGTITDSELYCINTWLLSISELLKCLPPSCHRSSPRIQTLWCKLQDGWAQHSQSPSWQPLQASTHCHRGKPEDPHCPPTEVNTNTAHYRLTQLSQWPHFTINNAQERGWIFKTPLHGNVQNIHLTWQASTFPSVYPAQSIRGVISPLYMQELLHFFVLIMGTGASFRVSGDWTESKYTYLRFSCQDTKCTLSLCLNLTCNTCKFVLEQLHCLTAIRLCISPSRDPALCSSRKIVVILRQADRPNCLYLKRLFNILTCSKTTFAHSQ